MARSLRAAALLFAVALVVASACGKRAGSSGSVGEVNVAAFKGGYGLDFFEQAAIEYGKAHPGVKIKVWGNPRVWEQLRPLFLAGNPPDLSYPGWGMDHWPLVYENQLNPLDTYLDGKPWDGEGTWRDTFEAPLLKLGQYQGKQYMLPYFYNIHGWWYNRTLFEKHGWQPPKTYSELLALCAKIKAAGIAPITYQGKYPYYAMTGFIFPWVIGSGGIKAADDAQNLVPGAWKSAHFLKAAQMVKELRDKGFFQEGANGLSHTESQMAFIGDHAAMIPCGTWLHTEMQKSLPGTGLDMRFMVPPVLDAGPGDPGNVGMGIEPWVAPAKGKNTKVAVDFFRYMTSLPKAKQFVEAKGTLMAIKGSDTAKLPPHLEEPAKVFRASKTVWSLEYIQWYPKLGTASQNALAALMTGEATPEQFVDRLEAAAEETRRDTTIPRHEMTR